MQLPAIYSTIKELSLFQTRWKSILDPFLSNPSNDSSILKGILLANGTTVVNHLLGRPLIGWRIVGINGAATVYDKQTSNATPQTTLVLVSNAAVTVNLEVF